jgi:hypothetical protein
MQQKRSCRNKGTRRDKVASSKSKEVCMCIQERRQLQWTNDHSHKMVAEGERDETTGERIRILC